QHTENLSKLIDTLDLKRITLVAHDWGGAIGLGAAAQRPDRFARIVLLNTGAFRAPRIPWRIRVCRTPLLGKLLGQGGHAFARGAVHMAVEKHDRMTPAVKAGLLAPYDSWSHRRATYEFVKDIPMRERDRSYAALVAVEQGLAKLAHLPVQLIWGMRDWCFTP